MPGFGASHRQTTSGKNNPAHQTFKLFENLIQNRRQTIQTSAIVVHSDFRSTQSWIQLKFSINEASSNHNILFELL